MALREQEWRGHTQWVCDEHRFDTLRESTAREHVAEFHADEATTQAALASLVTAHPATPADPDAAAEKKGK